MKRILVLGDSTSSTIGLNSENWLSLLQKDSRWSDKLIFIDTSVPGATAGSCYITLTEHLIRKRGRIDLVILSIGNCDRIDRPYRANKITSLKIIRALIATFFNKNLSRRRNWHKVGLGRWINDEPQMHTQNSGDFEKSLKRIKTTCKLLKIPIIVLIPRSNMIFPPMVARNNSIYYEIINHSGITILGDDEKIHSLEILMQERPDSKLFNDAVKKVSSLSRFELERIANNYLVRKFHKDESKFQQNEFLKLVAENTLTASIAAYNFACSNYLSQSNADRQSSLFELAINIDTGSYRVNNEYSSIVERVFKDTQKTVSVQLNQPKFDRMFLDHCHLLPEGQKELKGLISAAISNYISSGEQESELRYALRNSEYLEGDSRNFLSFYLTSNYNDVSIEELNMPNQFIGMIQQESSEIKRVRFYELKQSWVWIKFIMMNDLGDFNSLSNFVCDHLAGLNRLFDQIGLGEISSTPLDMLKIEASKLEEVSFRTVEEEILDFLNAGQNASLRMRTIMRWYFRESLYFGFNSNINMLFDRLRLMQIKEKILIGMVLEIMNVQNERRRFEAKFLDLFDFVVQVEKELMEFYMNKMQQSTLTQDFSVDENEISKLQLERWHRRTHESQ